MDVGLAFATIAVVLTAENVRASLEIITVILAAKDIRPAGDDLVATANVLTPENIWPTGAIG